MSETNEIQNELSADQKKLLRDKKALEEINRHLWIESEKAGCDIGFDSAAVDWLERFSKAWMDYHMPKQANAAKPKKTTKAKAQKTAKKKQTPA